MTYDQAISELVDLSDQCITAKKPNVFDRIRAALEVNPAVRSVLVERDAQDAKWGEQNHHPMVWLAILGEEFGELSQAVVETHFDNGPEARKLGGAANIRKEAVQVAAVAIAMIESIDREED